MQCESICKLFIIHEMLLKKIYAYKGYLLLKKLISCQLSIEELIFSFPFLEIHLKKFTVTCCLKEKAHVEQSIAYQNCFGSAIFELSILGIK